MAHAQLCENSSSPGAPASQGTLLSSSVPAFEERGAQPLSPPPASALIAFLHKSRSVFYIGLHGLLIPSLCMCFATWISSLFTE